MNVSNIVFKALLSFPLMEFYVDTKEQGCDLFLTYPSSTLGKLIGKRRTIICMDVTFGFWTGPEGKVCLLVSTLLLC
jgi:hypothetical protein